MSDRASAKFTAKRPARATHGETPAAETLMDAIGHIRRCFWLLKSITDEAVADLGLTASTRAILEHLDEAGPRTVSQIAADKNVARQSIQTLVDELHDAGLLAFKVNPAHRRSPLFVMTPAATKIFAEVRKRDRALLRRLARDLDQPKLAAAVGTLRSLRIALTKLRGKDI